MTGLKRVLKPGAIRRTLLIGGFVAGLLLLNAATALASSGIIWGD